MQTPHERGKRVVKKDTYRKPLFLRFAGPLENFADIPPDLLNFVLTALFALLIGLEQRRHHDQETVKFLFGTDRTFALIGILGFVLYILDKERMLFFGAGGLVLACLLAVVYAGRIWKSGQFGMTTSLIALITYCLAPLVYTQPPWLVLLILIAVLILTEIRESLIAFSAKFDKDEFVTLAKFIALAGVILPLTPREQVIPGIDLTPYKFWLAIVAVSSISYISYLLKKFVFPQAGIIFTGVLGGLYSSTAATFSLAGKTKNGDYPPLPTAAAILAATAMMYLRILALAFFFHAALGYKLLWPFLLLAATAAGAAGYLLFLSRGLPVLPIEANREKQQRNPLEFRTALLFAVLFVFFTALTYYVMRFYGGGGVKALSFIVGVTDIDPFLLNLFQSKETFDMQLVVVAALQATISNNILKMAYAMLLGAPAMRRYLLAGFGAVIAVSVGVLLLSA